MHMSVAWALLYDRKVLKRDTLRFSRVIGFSQFLTGDFSSGATATDVQGPFRREIDDDNSAFEKSLEILGQIK
jgi:hypothetical protein